MWRNLAGALSILFILACGPGQEPTEQKELVLLCGSSFVPPANDLCELFTSKTGVKVASTTGGSEDLLPLIKAGQKGDIFITHDPYLDYVRDAQALADHAHVGYVAPVLVVQKGNPQGLKRIEDLAKPALKVALTPAVFDMRRDGIRPA